MSFEVRRFSSSICSQKYQSVANCSPDSLRRRRSLSDVFLIVKDNVKAKLRRGERSLSSDEIDSLDFKVIQTHPGGSSQDSSEDASSPTAFLSGTVRHSPPQLEGLTEFPTGNLARSSTFRTGFEKAADSINTKYQNPFVLSGLPVRPTSFTFDTGPSSFSNQPATPAQFTSMQPLEEEASENSTLVSENGEALTSDKPIECEHRNRDQFSSRVPARYIDMILEITQALRNPPEEAPQEKETQRMTTGDHYRSKVKQMCHDSGIDYNNLSEGKKFNNTRSQSNIDIIISPPGRTPSDSGMGPHQQDVKANTMTPEMEATFAMIQADWEAAMSNKVAVKAIDQDC